MPCNCEYLEARPEERESKRAATLIVYVCKQMNRTAASWIAKASKDYYGNEDHLNDLVVMLCDLCTKMTKKQKDEIIYNGRNKTARDLADWWEEHLEADRERMEDEKQEKLRKAALKKLTAVERKLLGV